VPDILALTREQDLVHLAYYLLIHPLLLLDHSITPVRVVSVGGAVLTAVLVVRIGRALAGWPVGLASGLLLVASPTASRYAQEARSFSLVAAAVALSTLLLIRGTERTVARTRSFWWWAGYVVLLVVVALGNLLGLLCLLGQAVYVVTTPRRYRPLLVGQWLACVAAAGIALMPFVHSAAGQTQQVSWLLRPGTAQLVGMLSLVWTPAGAAAALLVLAIVAVVRRGSAGARRALAVGLAWGVLPPLVLWAVAQVKPLYHEHYLFAQAGGAALAVGSLAGVRLRRRPARHQLGTRAGGDVPSAHDSAAYGLDGAGSGPASTQVQARTGAGRALRVGLAAALPAIVLGAAGLPQQVAYRQAIGHGEDIPAVARSVDAQARPGDAIVYLPYWLRLLAMAYPVPQGVDEVALARTGEQSASITGEVVGPAQALDRLAGRCRVLVVTQTSAFAGYGPTDQAVVDLLTARYVQVHKDAAQGFDVLLFRSRDPQCAAQA